ncbi:MAG: TraR/DksA family transcriptional regulator [Candidatus Omnitrophica bacterium]|nr:TraR/DksA family transcriptional regulator [Candidatus Omnitrophota bacterium]
MPQKKVDKKQRELCRKQLLKIKENILHDIKNMASVNSVDSSENGGESAGHGMHIADAATDMYDREFTLSLASNDRELLSKIDDALNRITNKSFGLCFECEEAIPAARLEAIPYAETCLKCQEEREKNS